jgi:hypothetical protein
MENGGRRIVTKPDARDKSSQTQECQPMMNSLAGILFYLAAMRLSAEMLYVERLRQTGCSGLVCQVPLLSVSVDLCEQPGSIFSENAGRDVR